MFKGKVLFSTVCISFLSSNFICLAAALDSQYLKIILEVNKSHKEQFESFACSYSVDIERKHETDNTRVLELSKEGAYAFKGEKVFTKESILGQDGTLHFVKNGSTLTFAYTEPGISRMIGQQADTEGPKKVKPGSPNPWNETGQNLVFELSEGGFKGRKARFISEERVEIDGEDFIKVEMNRVHKDDAGNVLKIPTTMWFNCGKNFLLQKCEFDSDVFKGRSEVTQIGEYSFNGQMVYMPLECRSHTTFSDGRESWTKYKIKKESIKINPELPDTLFEIQILPGDQVINLDVGIELQGPGGGNKFLANALAGIDDDAPEEASKNIAKKELEEIRLCGDSSIKLVKIPKGSFVMGSPPSEVGYDKRSAERMKKKNFSTHIEREGPAHRVAIEEDFYLSRHEITCAQFKCFDPRYKRMPHDGFKMDKSDYPSLITWNRAVDFCEWLSKRTGLKVRLPYESEWEYACRAGSRTRFYWGNEEEDAGKYANVRDMSYAKKWPGRASYHLNTNDTCASISAVGQYKPNKFGLYDMIGNVAEWCQDIYLENAYSLSERELKDAQEKVTNSERVYRGGSFAGSIMHIRCASRWGAKPSDSNLFVGFRIVVEEK